METPLVNCGSRSFSLRQYNNRNQALFTFCNLLFIYFTASISFHSIQLILCFQQTGVIDNLTVSWGKVFWLCCAGSSLLLTPVARSPTTSQPATPSKRLPSPTGRLNLGFILRENLLMCDVYACFYSCRQCWAS